MQLALVLFIIALSTAYAMRLIYRSLNRPKCHCADCNRCPYSLPRHEKDSCKGKKDCEKFGYKEKKH